MAVQVNPYRYATTGAAASNLEVALGGFNAPNSGTTGTTCTVSGLAFQPVFVFLWMTGRTETDDNSVLTSATSRMAFGMMDASAQYSWASGQVHNSASSNNGIRHNTGTAMYSTNAENGGSGQLFRGLNLTSLNSDGFTLEIGSAGTRAWVAERINYLALGGSDLSMTKVGTASVTSGTGNESYTPLASTPKALIFPNLNVALNTFAGPIMASIGMASGASNQFVWVGQSDQNVATMDTARYLRADECQAFADTGGTALTGRTRMVSLDATGWTLNRLESTGSNYTLPYGALGGAINAYVGTFTASSGGGSVTGVGFTPKAILFLTHGTTQSTADTLQQDEIWSIGAAITGVTQMCAHVHDVDNQANSVIARGHRNDSVAATTDSSAALDSRVAISSLDSDGFTYTMPTNTNNGYLVGFLALG
jgi:uncharacterized spore protein YtfJ